MQATPETQEPSRGLPASQEPSRGLPAPENHAYSKIVSTIPQWCAWYCNADSWYGNRDSRRSGKEDPGPVQIRRYAQIDKSHSMLIGSSLTARQRRVLYDIAPTGDKRPSHAPQFEIHLAWCIHLTCKGCFWWHWRWGYLFVMDYSHYDLLSLSTLLSLWVIRSNYFKPKIWRYSRSVAALNMATIKVIIIIIEFSQNSVCHFRTLYEQEWTSQWRTNWKPAWIWRQAKTEIRLFHNPNDSRPQWGEPEDFINMIRHIDGHSNDVKRDDNQDSVFCGTGMLHHRMCLSIAASSWQCGEMA